MPSIKVDENGHEVVCMWPAEYESLRTRIEKLETLGDKMAAQYVVAAWRALYAAGQVRSVPPSVQAWRKERGLNPEGGSDELD